MSSHRMDKNTAVYGHSELSPETRRILRHPPRQPVYCRPRQRARDRDCGHDRDGTGAGEAGAAPAVAEPDDAPVPGALTEWHDMSPGEQMTAWAQLRAFVTWLADRYELTVDERLPCCWASHPGLVEELWALRAWRLEIYGGTAPSAGQAARYWHAELERVIHAASSRYAAGCRAGHRGATGLVSVDAGLQESWAAANLLSGVPPVDIAAGRARRAGNRVSREEMAAAFDAGDAAPVPGLRDYVQYGGAWWVPAAGGWVRVPSPAVPGRVNGTPDENQDDEPWAR